MGRSNYQLHFACMKEDEVREMLKGGVSLVVSDLLFRELALAGGNSKAGLSGARSALRMRSFSCLTFQNHFRQWEKAGKYF